MKSVLYLKREKCFRNVQQNSQEFLSSYIIFNDKSVNDTNTYKATALALNYKCHTTLGINHCWIAGSGMFTGYLLKKKIWHKTIAQKSFRGERSHLFIKINSLSTICLGLEVTVWAKRNWSSTFNKTLVEEFNFQEYSITSPVPDMLKPCCYNTLHQHH